MLARLRCVVVVPNRYWHAYQHTHQHIRQQTGSSMIEVLIALVITAFSLLGLAGLQLTVVRHQNVAHFRALATVMSANLVERVHANRDGARDGQYSSALQSYPHQPTDNDVPRCENAMSCTHAEIAAMDLYEWRKELGLAMAGGWGEVSGSMDQGFVVRVYFKESGNQDGLNTHADDAALSQNNCRMAALNAEADKDVRCFVTIFSL
ncbi:MAG: type IV pilus modification protein PilV [Glaciimonas sp.]|nr:type IV pilus modification protein PilV [Glaciimonas sp.]